MKRPLAKFRPIGPFSNSSDLHQDILIVLPQFSGIPSNVRAIADQASEQTVYQISQDDVSVSVNSEGDMVLTIHTHGPDLKHRELMTVLSIVEDVTGNEIKHSIVRAKS